MTDDAGSPRSDPSGQLVASAPGAVATMDAPGDPARPSKRKRRRQLKAPGEKRWVAGVFLLPAAVFLLAVVFYPFVYTVVRSFFNDSPTGEPNGFAGWSQYTNIFSNEDAFRSFKNNLIWVLVVPAVATMLGLIFAVLTERVRWSSAFKIVLFMPIAISFVAVGVTWSLIYADQPTRGLANTITTGVHSWFGSNSSFPELNPSPAATGPGKMTGTQAKGFTTGSYPVGQEALVPVAGFDLTSPPSNAKPAQSSSGSGLHGTVWNDFKLGGGGSPGKIDQGELGVPGITVQAVQNGSVVASTKTASDGTFSFPQLTSGSYQMGLPSSDFSAPFGGFTWLGKSLITWSIIIAYLWMYTGFCLVLLAAGMAAIPRDALEAARMDGATEFQVFRRVTAPLLAPVLMVVFVTMVINVLKVFDIVYIIGRAGGAYQKYSDVLATQLYREYGQFHYGAASAVGVVLVILVLPAMAFQIWRFRKDSR